MLHFIFIHDMIRIGREYIDLGDKDLTCLMKQFCGWMIYDMIVLFTILIGISICNQNEFDSIKTCKSWTYNLGTILYNVMVIFMINLPAIRKFYINSKDKLLGAIGRTEPRQRVDSLHIHSRESD